MTNTRKRIFIGILLLPLLAAILVAFACSSGSPSGTLPGVTTSGQTTTPSGARINLTGAGATFPYPLYSKMFSEYSKISNVDVNYQSIGSGGGIRQITEKTVDFGASDGIMTDAQSAAAPAKLLHIPMTSGAVAVVYNLPGLSTGLKLTADILADIYLKKLTKWNDSRITALNPGVNIPANDIAVVHRSDGSGTTFIFTNYLSKVSQEWKDKVGNATSVKWPGDIGGQGNEGVAGQVKQIAGAIGYVELAYATQNNIPFASLKNKSGNFVAPSIEATTATAQGVELPDDMKVMLTDSANPAAYPISGFTWILAYQVQTDQVKGKALVDLLWWSIHDGQKYGPPLLYASLSADAVKKTEALIKSITYQGQPLLDR
ncbi:MAG: phosphate ABC transporter substrate-binding protein PstS [Chloroflexi bacterium]|nr:phosphate ABC transporter substrate-binding protein PstS [Chloroflexota bacterium]